MYLNEENKYTCIVRKLMETKGETKTFNVGTYRNNFVSHLFWRSGTWHIQFAYAPDSRVLCVYYALQKLRTSKW